MQWIKVTIQPQSGFATALKGDTLFGQLCWAIREAEGEAALVKFLSGYSEGRPFAVVSDAFPAGYLPRPKMPNRLLGWANLDARGRKVAKQKHWLPFSSAAQPLILWGEEMVTAAEVAEESEGNPRFSREVVAPHNTLNRLTNATGTGQFAPYNTRQTWYAPGISLAVFVLIDDQRISVEQLQIWWTAMGLFGVGKDATVGMGKFTLASIQHCTAQAPASPKAYLTLSPAALQGEDWLAERCYYQTFTRFGRHGGELAVAGYPFKNPILMAETGAILTPRSMAQRDFVGQGLGGDGTISRMLTATVHQGYAPVMPVCFG